MFWIFIVIFQVISHLTELVRDNFRNAKVKVTILPALGEVLHLVATQEEIKGHSVDLWSVPAMTYTFLIRCLREGVSVLLRSY